MNKDMDLCIIILNYKTYKMTLELINNIEKISVGNKIHIVVIDNNSRNESAEILRAASELGKRFHFIENTENSGYAAGNNIGLRYAVEKGYEFALISNNDIIIKNRNSLDTMIALMRKNPNIGAVSPRIIHADGRKDPPIYVKLPSLWDMTFGIYANHKNRYRFDDYSITQIYAPRGSFMLLRLNMMKMVGYMDENTFLYYEEPILAEKMKKISGECWHCGEAEVIHNHGKTISTVIAKKKTCSILCESLEYYLREYRGMSDLKIAIYKLFRTIVYMRR